MKIDKNCFQAVTIIEDRSAGNVIDIADSFMFVEPLKDLQEVDFWKNRLTKLCVPYILAKVGYRDRLGEGRAFAKIVNGFSFFVQYEDWQRVV